jgi:signal transduction histidine kinase
MPILLVGAVNAAALLARKRYPTWTLAACLVMTATIAAALHHTYPVGLVILIALYAVGRYCPRGIALASAIITMIITFVVANLIHAIPDYTFHNLAELAWIPVAVLAGAWIRTQRRYLIGAEERAERAERDREEEARRRVTEERLRIARELHDIVGHALMSINVTSSVSARFATRDPAAAREALHTINSVSGSALSEIRSTLNLLRGDVEPLTEPALGLEDLPVLVEKTRLAGLPVSLHETGNRTDVPSIVGFTVYRIVQESLTNVVRHAKDVTQVTIDLTFAPESLEVSVTNDGADAAVREETGIGIQGMRERVAATGGRLDTTALTTGGFRVHARLPLKESQR